MSAGLSGELGNRTSSGGQGSEAVADADGVTIVNASGFDNGVIMAELHQQYPEFAALVNWSNGLQRRGGGGIFERDRYVTPTKVLDQMRAAQYAVEYDDICAGVLESSEALAFSKMSVECWDEDEEDIWNQVTDDIDLDTRMREMWRELFSVSQFYAFTWFGRKSYKVRGKSEKGIARKKIFSGLYVPLGISLLDPLRVVPVGNMLFNQDRLAYIANREDSRRIEPILNGSGQDPVIQNMFLSKYEPDLDERRQLASEGVDTTFLYLLNPLTVWRHTDTRPQYQRWASVRMKSVFELLDLKQQLKEMDRATLLGSTNFLVLIKKGSKEEPATQDEIANLQNNMRTMARVPFIFGDHRLEIEIITPKNENTLKPERYASLNGQISARLFQMFVVGGTVRGDDSIKMARVISRGLESRRQQLLRQVERMVFDPMYQVNSQLTSEPGLRFHPKQIALDFDPGLANMLLDLRDRREISRDTILSQLDLSEVDEARKREREAEHFDEIFKTLSGLPDPELQHELQLDTLAHEQLVPKATGVPATKGTPTATNPSGARGTPVKKKSAPTDTTTGGGGKQDPKGAGRTRGGNRKGGGAAPGTGQGQEADPRRRAKNATKAA